MPKAAWIAGTVLAVAVVVVIVVLAAGSSSKTESGVAFTGSGYPNGDLSNTRHSSGPISKATVSKLGVAWTLPFKGKSQFGSFASAPVIAKGVVYMQDLASNVQALSLKTGKVLWTKSYEIPDFGPNGIVVAGGRVFGATETSVFALDEKTGNQLWSVSLVRNEHEGIDMAPGYHNGIVYVSTVPGNMTSQYGGEAVGILWALDGRTGRKLWHFDTAPEDLWSSAHASINAGGGVWYPPAFDEEDNMYIGTANPAPFPGNEQFPWGSSRPGPNLYTDALVKLNATTGKLEWYYQAVPHDLYDWDLQNSPILMNVRGRPAVIASGKCGLVIALDRKTGKPIWKQTVGTHNGHDHDGLLAMKGGYSKLKLPETVYPGQLGGSTAPISTNGSEIFVSTVNMPVTYSSQTNPQEGPESTGEVVALDAGSGAVKWDHKFDSPAFASTTAVNDLVFTTTFNGTLYALDAASGEVAWEVGLPAGSNAGVAVSGDTVIAGAGKASSESQTPELVAYRLGAGSGK